jgi:hypothetical protein
MTTTVPAIPGSIDDVTAAWLAEATGWEIRSLTAEHIGKGIGVSSAVYRLHLDGDGCPDTVVVKVPALDEAAVFTSTILRMYIREARFFNELAHEAPVRVPGCHHAAVDEETSRFVVVMEDLGGLRAVDQVDGMGLDDAERAVDDLARWHATWWGRARPLTEAGLAVSLADPIYPAVLPMVFAEGWDKVTGAMDVADSILEVGPRFSDAMAGLLADLAAGPSTMIHGDYRADNLFFDTDGSVALLDFQLLGEGSAAYDLAYFVTQSISADVAADHERALFDRWEERLREEGVPAGDLGGMWADYRKAALFCLVYPIVASRGMDFEDPRQLELVRLMNERFARAVDQLELVDLLP